MRIVTQSAIDISESLATYILGSHIYNTRDVDAIFEKRMEKVNTAKYTIADLYIPNKDVAFEVKSVEHGTSALKGCLQASIYKEQTKDAVLCMQRPRRKGLRSTLESLCDAYGIGLIYIESIPSVCSDDTIDKATGGCSKPFELWKDRTFTRTRDKIIANSRSGWADEYVVTLDQVIDEYAEEIFNFKIEPDSESDGLDTLYGSDTPTPTVGDF